jgi:ABC-type antimicrobial peptide transport system permease subunit
MALGADAKGVLGLVLAKALRPVALGLVIGAAVGLWASRFVASLLYGLEPGDLPTLFVVAAALAVVCALAAALPARRAARIDPAGVLREG